jgi:hypothetical protein
MYRNYKKWQNERAVKPLELTADIQTFLDWKFVFPYPHKDKFGRAVIYVRGDRFFPKATNKKQALDSMAYIVEAAIAE